MTKLAAKLNTGSDSTCFPQRFKWPLKKWAVQLPGSGPVLLVDQTSSMEKGGRAVVVWKCLEQMPRSAKMLSLELRPSGRLLLLAVSSPWRWSPIVGRGKPEIIFFKKSREG